MVDVNGLKLTNDAFGHNAGDDLLKHIAFIMKDECRDDDIIARIGGDEFIVLLPQTTSEAAGTLVNRIHKKASMQNIESIPISISAGWATKTLMKQKMSELYVEAENHMYSKN